MGFKFLVPSVRKMKSLIVNLYSSSHAMMRLTERLMTASRPEQVVEGLRKSHAEGYVYKNGDMICLPSLGSFVIANNIGCDRVYNAVTFYKEYHSARLNELPVHLDWILDGKCDLCNKNSHSNNSKPRQKRIAGQVESLCSYISKYNVFDSDKALREQHKRRTGWKGGK
jgi:hypothetical protein